MTNKDTIYISSADNDGVLQKTAAVVLSRKGYKPVLSYKVQELVGEIGLQEVNRLRIAVLAECTSLYLLQGWQESSQCVLELAYARQTGKQVLYQAYSLRRGKQNGSTSNDNNGE